MKFFASLVAAFLSWPALLAVGCGTNASDQPSASGGASGTSPTTQAGASAASGAGGEPAHGGAAGSSAAGGSSSGAASGGASGASGESGSAGFTAGGASGSGGRSGAGGAPCSASTGKAVQFSLAVVDLMTADLGADLPQGNAARTIEVWAKYTSEKSWTAEHSVLEIGKGANGNQVFGIDGSSYQAPNGVLDPYTNGFGDNDPTSFAAPETGWFHFSWGYDGLSPGHFRFSVNGQEIQLAHAAGTPDQMLKTTTGTLTLAASQNFGMNGFDGILDEIRIWTVYRETADVARDMKVLLTGNEPGLVAYYHLDEGSGTTSADATGKASHLLTMSTDVKPKWVDSDLGASAGPFTCP